MVETLQEDFDAERFILEKERWIKDVVGRDGAAAATSGGVDSTTTVLLAHKALGANLVAVFLDDGLMREGEPMQVVEQLGNLGINVRIYDTSQAFFDAFVGLTDPEEKRKVFRSTFYKSLSRIVRELGCRYLLQGTIAADIVETTRGVKTQHNVLSQIGIDSKSSFGYEVLEPLRELYKHQVRMVARAFGVSRELSERRPFPGPGLSIRILGEVTREKVDAVRKATRIVEEETREAECFQAFAVLMNDRATGVTAKGRRSYGRIITVRVVESLDAMEAKSKELSWSILEKIAARITGEVSDVSRVLYDLTSKPPSTIEFE